MSKLLMTPPSWWGVRCFSAVEAEEITHIQANTVRTWQRAAAEPFGVMDGGRRLFSLHELYQLVLVGILHDYGIARPQTSYAIARDVSHAGHCPRPPYFGDVARVTQDGLIPADVEPEDAYIAISLEGVWKEVVRRAELVRAANA